MPSGANAEHFRLGEMVYVWRGGQLEDATGQCVPLRAKSLKMFRSLLSERGTTVSKQRLSEMVWPNTVATDESVARCIADIRKALKDDDHCIVQTFAKQGYRLNASIMPNKRDWFPSQSTLRWLAAGTACVFFFFSFFAFWETHLKRGGADFSAISSASHNLVAIIPPTTEDKGTQFLATGFTDDLEIHLAKVPGIRLLSQAQTSTAAGMERAPVALARHLDARYIVQSTLRENETLVALSIKLIDGVDGATIWADRYEGTPDKMSDFRDAVPGALVKAISAELARHTPIEK